MAVSNIPSKATDPVLIKFHVQPLGPRKQFVLTNGPCHTTNMAALPIYGKTLIFYFCSETSGPMTLELYS